jgi:hypothetical protein
MPAMRKMKNASDRQKIGPYVQLRIGKSVRSRTLKFQSLQQFRLLLILLTTLSVIHRRPFEAAPHGVSRSCGTSATSASNLDTGRPTVHSTTSRLQPTAVISKPVLQQNNEATCVNDKYFDYLVCSDSYEFSSSYEFANFLSQVFRKVRYFLQ